MKQKKKKRMVNGKITKIPLNAAEKKVILKFNII